MNPHEETPGSPSPESRLHQELAELREAVHVKMKEEFRRRLETDPTPSEQELRAGAFKEWLEPQVREAAFEMMRKGYGTQSSGFYGYHNELQAVDGYFTIDEGTKKELKELGIDVLRGPELGLPENKIITQLRFTPIEADIQKVKERWDAAAALLPMKERPSIADRAEEFRQEFAPDHASFEEERASYFKALRDEAGVQ